MTPAEAKPFLYAVDAAIASHNAAIASLHAMRAVLVASMGCHDPAEVPAASGVTPVVATAAPAPRKGKGGRPRKHFADRPSTAAERVAFARRDVTKPVTKPVSQQPLSLSLNSYSLEDSGSSEREGVAKPVAKHTLPPGFQPDQRRAQLARDGLGEIGARNCLAKFRNHHEVSGVVCTAAGWQAKFENWVISDWSFVTPSFATGVSQHELPLVRAVSGSTGRAESPVAAVVIIRRETPQADAWEKHNGKPFLWGIRSQATVPTEWPPGHEPARKEASG
jgi:hypothetical protein